MRKTLVSVLMIPLLLLGGCGEREARLEKGFERFRSGLIAASSLTTRASLTADRDETVEEYVLDVTYDGQETVMELVEPAVIAGVRASAKWGETSVSCGDVMLGAGPLDGDGLDPVSAVPAILAAMTGGYVELLWWDGTYIAARLYVSDAVRCTVWLEEDTLIPTAAELSCDGRTVLSCGFEDWTVA